MEGHTVCWVDIPVKDLERSIAFYTKVLGAEVTKQSRSGLEFGLLPHEDNVSGCLYASKDNQPSITGLLVYLSVEGRLDAAIEAARSNGGRLLQPKESIAPYGFRAILSTRKVTESRCIPPLRNDALLARLCARGRRKSIARRVI